MKDADIYDLVDRLDEKYGLISRLAPYWLPDIRAGEGEHTPLEPRPHLAPDMRDPEYTPEAPFVAEPTGPDVGDPTGDAALSRDVAREDLAHIVAMFKRHDRETAHALERIRRHQRVRTFAEIETLRAEPPDLDTREWCASHLRLNVLEPLTINRSTGSPYYATMCRSCGDLLASLRTDHPDKFPHTRTMPPIDLLRIRVMGRRVTDRDVREAVGA